MTEMSEGMATLRDHHDISLHGHPYPPTPLTIPRHGYPSPSLTRSACGPPYPQPYMLCAPTPMAGAVFAEMAGYLARVQTEFLGIS